MRILLDVNLILDVLADRERFAEDSGRVLSLVEAEILEGWVAAHTITTLYYLLQQSVGQRKAQRAIRDLLGLFNVAAVDTERLAEALGLGMTDFEDAVQVACAAHVQARYIVTRNVKDFRRGPVDPITPTGLLTVVTAPS